MREELTILDRLAASNRSRDPAAARVAAQIRRLLVRARLGEIEHAAAKQQAEELLAAAHDEADAAEGDDLRTLVAAFDWYGSPFARRLDEE